MFFSIDQVDNLSLIPNPLSQDIFCQPFPVASGSKLAMDAMILRELVNVESAPPQLPSAPAKAVSRVYPGVPQTEDSIELQRLARPASLPAGSGASTPREEIQDLEMSRPPSPDIPVDGVEVLPSIWEPYMNRFRLLSTCLVNFRNGLNDSAPGALIPYMETYVLNSP